MTVSSLGDQVPEINRAILKMRLITVRGYHLTGRLLNVLEGGGWLAFATCGGVLFGQGPSSSAEVRGLVIHDIKEEEGVRQQEEQEDKRD